MLFSVSSIGKGVLERMGEHFDERIRNQRVLTTPDHYAYLKISEGCNRTCSYCAIPIMTGKHKSRDFEELLEECRALVKGSQGNFGGRSGLDLLRYRFVWKKIGWQN